MNAPRTLGLIAEECYALALRRAARAVSRRYDEAFSELDLNNGQFSMLALIEGLGPVRMTTLAERLAMDRTTVTAALKPLVRRGLVEVEVSPSDPRGRDASLTKAGRSILARAIPIWRELQQAVAANLSTEQSKLLRRALDRVQ
ncbi:MAG: MarR family transcriptional regulator [Deltaproteobacteria bacterium]|nr:MarR family transcriptional regulator [Nannocystaceae bacterium]